MVYSVQMTCQRIGYSRVSTIDQNPDAQRDALTAANVDRLFIEHFSGTKASRPEWDKVKDLLRPGDTLVVTRLDRMSRSAKDLLEIGEWLEKRGVDLEATEQRINTKSPEGRMFFTILAAFAQFERDLIVARTRDGLAAARARGRKGGRKPKLTAQKIADIKRKYEGGDTVQSIATYFGVSRPTIYRALAA
ncbi:recombinase family protein [Microbacterium sp. ZW T2_14]|uniref:recombinase family protein n=1 Tax=Microbacterium sp. ZW T2_14 TaxID=3378079 RepID=UPI003855011C